MDWLNRTPLFYAKSVEIAQVLISNGANVNVRDDMGRTPLHFEIYEKPSEIVHLYYNDTTFDVYDISTKMIKFLLSNGADVNARDNDNKTPVYRASLKIARLLLSNGAKINAGDRHYFKLNWKRIGCVKQTSIYEEELIINAWHPFRFQKWCLDIEEQKELYLMDH